eukprot:2337408-Lingulodinium_polyedra.AAC.1
MLETGSHPGLEAKFDMTLMTRVLLLTVPAALSNVRILSWGEHVCIQILRATGLHHCKHAFSIDSGWQQWPQ